MSALRRLAVMALALLALVRPAMAQSPTADGTWQGTLGSGAGALRLVLRLTRSADGLLLGSLESVDQGGVRIPIDRVQVSGDSVRLELRSVGGLFEGALADNGAALRGRWSQGGPAQPLQFTRQAAAPAAAAATAPADTTRSPFGPALLFAVHTAPAVFPGGGRVQVAWELQLMNWNPAREATVTAIEVLAGDSVIARLEGAELNGAIVNPFPRGDVDRRVLAPGRGAMAYLWLTFPDARHVPATIRHRITVDGQTAQGAVATIAAGAPPVLSPPLHGSGWVAVNGPDNTSGHRRAAFVNDGAVTIAQRLAIDWVQRGADGRTFTGDPRSNQNYHAWGSEALAVGDGTVSSIMDSIPENVPGSRAVPITPATIGGNYVVLDLGRGRFAFYAHLQPGSLRVRPGQRVRRGEVLGLVGNSGNSTEPHLHFHVTDGPSPLGAEGVAYVLERYQVWTAGAWAPRSRELPMANDVVQFP